jgi:hypothetical protein
MLTWLRRHWQDVAISVFAAAMLYLGATCQATL